MQRHAEQSDIGGADRPHDDEIAAQLERILASEAFDASGRNRNFLRYVVEETVAGRSGHIKGYTVAQQVFGRSVDFDPQLDPVVRIEASRLRRSLERYYLTTGKTDAVRIELPKGGYVPRFEWALAERTGPERPLAAVAADEPPQPRTGRVRGPAIIILPFENLVGGVDGDLLAKGITEELIGRLIAYPQLSVICANTSFRLGAAADPGAVGRDLALGYLLKGGIRIAGARVRISVQLLDVEDGRYLWAESFDRELTSTDIWSVQEELAAKIATQLGAPYGAVARLSQESLARGERRGVDDYIAILKAYGYRRQMNPGAHSEVRECLERAVALNPRSVDAWAHLALVYIDEYRFGLNPKPDPLGRALAAAEQAIKWGSGNALSHLASSLVHHYRREHEKAHALARYAVTLNPDNPEVLAQAATRLMLSGAWDEGMVLLNRAIARDPEPPAWNYILLTLDALRRADYPAALHYAEAAGKSHLPHVLVLLCAIYDGLGRPDQAAAALDAACAEGRQWSELWEQVCRSVHDDALLQQIERGVARAKSRILSGQYSLIGTPARTRSFL